MNGCLVLLNCYLLHKWRIILRIIILPNETVKNNFWLIASFRICDSPTLILICLLHILIAAVASSFPWPTTINIQHSIKFVFTDKETWLWKSSFHLLLYLFHIITKSLCPFSVFSSLPRPFTRRTITTTVTRVKSSSALLPGKLLSPECNCGEGSTLLRIRCRINNKCNKRPSLEQTSSVVLPLLFSRHHHQSPST